MTDAEREQWVRATWRRLSAEYFDGEVPPPIFVRIYGDELQPAARVFRHPGHGMPILDLQRAVLELPEERAADFLLHEMAHVAVWPEHGHDSPAFRREVARVTRLAFGTEVDADALTVAELESWPIGITCSPTTS